MAVVSVVKLSELEGAKRMDAKYYQQEFLEVKDKLLSISSKPLKSFLKILYRYPTFYNLQYYKEGVLVLKGEDITSEGFIQNQSQDFISVEDSKKFPKTILKEGNLIFSVRGYVGKIGIVDEKYEDSIISANLIRAELKDISPYFVWVFLNTKYGINQIDRVKMITAQETIIADDIKNFLIPLIGQLEQKDIENIARKAIQKVRESESFYSQAENLLLEELGLKDFKPKYEKNYTANLSQAFRVHRIDAEYFQPAYDEAIKSISKKTKIKKLKNVITFINHGKQPYYVENGEIPVITQKHLGPQLLSLKSEILVHADTPTTDRNFIEKYPEYRLKVGDVLFYSVGAYLGRTNVLLESIDAVPASFITLIRTKSEICNPIYLALFLNSKLGQIQSYRWKSASAQQYIYPKEIKEFLIPILPFKTQQKIASLVQQSHEARRKAKELLEEAKRKVEEAIENEIKK